MENFQSNVKEPSFAVSSHERQHSDVCVLSRQAALDPVCVFWDFSMNGESVAVSFSRREVVFMITLRIFDPGSGP